MTMSLLEYFLISAAGSALIILIGRAVLAAGLGRPADYYDAGEKRIEELFFGIPASASADRSITVSDNESEKSETETCQINPVETEHDRNERTELEEIKTEEIEPIESITTIAEEKEEPKEEQIPETKTESDAADDSDEHETYEVDVIESYEIATSETTEITECDIVEAAPESESESDDVVHEEVEEQKPIGFAIKAKTSREMQPKKKEEPEPLMTITDEGEKVSGWTESYAEIRESLEKAYDEKVKPSMRLKKQVLINIAEARGIEIPEKATKRVILDLINALEEEESDQA